MLVTLGYIRDNVNMWNVHLPSAAHSDRETQTADPSTWGCQRAEGEPWQERARGLRHPGQLLAGGEHGWLWALCENEICPYYWATQAWGQDQTGGGAAQVSDGQSPNGPEDN